MYALGWLLFWGLSILPGSIVRPYTAPSFSVLPETPTLLTSLLWTPGLEQRGLYSSIPVNCTGRNAVWESQQVTICGCLQESL